VTVDCRTLRDIRLLNEIILIEGTEHRTERLLEQLWLAVTRREGAAIERFS
jgi:hypothetical protein